MLWLEKMLEIIPFFKNLPRLDLWPKMWSILENVPRALERKTYSFAFRWMSWRYQWDPSHLMYHLKLCFLMNFLFWWPVHWCEWHVSLLLLLCYCQFLLLCLLVLVLCIEVLLCWVHRYLQLLCLPLGLIPWLSCSVLPYLF